jgi:hypothetical protein
MAQVKFDVGPLRETLGRNQTWDGRTRADLKTENRVSEAHRIPILTRGEIRAEPLDVCPETWKSAAVAVAMDSYPLREFLNSAVDS